MIDLFRTQKAIREECLDGWLFCNFRHRDSFTDDCLSVSATATNTRRWFCHVTPDSPPVAVVHSIESDILDHLGGEKREYITQEELRAQLRRFAGKRLAVLCDPSIQSLSTMDAASYLLIQECQIEPVSAARLVQRACGTLTSAELADHERTAAFLYGLVRDAWELVRRRFADGLPPYEGEISDYMLERIGEAALETDGPPIVAAGKNAGNPHYAAAGAGKRLERDDVVQFDVWAKRPGGVYADISWCGYCAPTVPTRLAGEFAQLTHARDLVPTLIERAATAGRAVTGAELDQATREALLSFFPPSVIRHRTGHGIDRECHGFGVNLDSVEFPDYRNLIEGSCFSVEPGVYFADYGFRTEINVYIAAGRPIVSGGEIQQSLLTL